MLLFSIFADKRPGCQIFQIPLDDFDQCNGWREEYLRQKSIHLSGQRTNYPDDRVKKGNVCLIYFISCKIHRIITSKTETV